MVLRVMVVSVSHFAVCLNHKHVSSDHKDDLLQSASPLQYIKHRSEINYTWYFFLKETALDTYMVLITKGAILPC